MSYTKKIKGNDHEESKTYEQKLPSNKKGNVDIENEQANSCLKLLEDLECKRLSFNFVIAMMVNLVFKYV